MESKNKPVAALVNQDFIRVVESTVHSKGMPGIRTISETIPCECSVPEEIEKGVSEVMEKLIAALTTPLTEEEKLSRTKEVEKPA
ncbi:MAG: hypothetical protein NUV31_09390, partial [Dehalococcoidales bacterium]|nr:hypothetical protein [Dehalococcoidales bacterium]